MTIATALWLAVAFVVTWAAAGAVRRYAISRSMMDVPNERSSHAMPVPRGGGMAIAVVVLGGVAVSGMLGAISSNELVALLGGGTLVALVGWLDDHGSVQAIYRATIHLVAAAWAVYWLGGYTTVDLLGARITLGAGGSILAIVGIVWSVNLYNFMDGIDGLAAGEAVCVGAFAGALLWHVGLSGLATISFLTAAAAAGFLVWNWAPAKIFLGDVGSGLLGFVFGGLAVASENQGGPPVIVFAILLGVFAFDATATLVRRVLRGERWYSAHHSHAYQRMVEAGWSHRRVSGSAFVLNLFLGGTAFLAIARPTLWPVVVALVIAVLTGAYVLVERRRPMGSASI